MHMQNGRTKCLSSKHHLSTNVHKQYYEHIKDTRPSTKPNEEF